MYRFITETCYIQNIVKGGSIMSKERSKDKGGTRAGLSKSFNNNRSVNGKLKNSEDTTNKNADKLSHDD